MHDQLINALLVDDDEDDYIIVRDLVFDIEAIRFNLEWTSTYEDGLEAIKSGQHDVYLIDYRLGARNGLELLREAIRMGCNEPMILLTGQGDREVDIEAMNAKAADYLVKDRIDADILERSIRYSIERKRVEKERDNVIAELQEALAKIRTLGGLLPMCSSCKRIRDDKGYWNQLESYIKEHSGAELSHSICPTCLKQLYPNVNLSRPTGPAEGKQRP